MILNKKGFTLVELIIVITILAILVTILFASFQSFTTQQKTQCIREMIGELKDKRQEVLATGYVPIQSELITSNLGDRCLGNSVTPNIKNEIKYLSSRSTGEFLLGIEMRVKDFEQKIVLSQLELSDLKLGEETYSVLSYLYPLIDKEEYLQGNFIDSEKVPEVKKLTPEEIQQKEKETKELYDLLKTIFLFFINGVIFGILVGKLKGKIKNKQLSWYRLYTFLVSYSCFRKIIIGSKDIGVDLEMYLHFQKLLLSQDFTKGTYGSILKVKVGEKSIIEVSGLPSNNEDLLERVEQMDSENLYNEFNVSVLGLDESDVPLYLYRMLYEKLQSYSKYKVQLEKIEQQTLYSKRKNELLSKELTKKRNLLNELKGTVETQEFMPLVTTVLELEQISKEHEALIKRTENLSSRKF